MEYATQEAEVSVVIKHGRIWHWNIWEHMPKRQPRGKQHDKPWEENREQGSLPGQVDQMTNNDIKNQIQGLRQFKILKSWWAGNKLGGKAGESK